jgi:hypothetical protein
MTDARFPERWLNDRRVLRLSDDAFRLFVCGLAWSVANKTDGYLSDEDLALIPGVNLEAAEALYDAELWWSHMHGAQITEFEDTQTSAAQLEAAAIARRANDRKRQDRHRSAGGASGGGSWMVFMVPLPPMYQNYTINVQKYYLNGTEMVLPLCGDSRCT